MLTPCWRDSLRQSLTANPEIRVAVVGIGHVLRGDDAAGPLVAECLQAELAADSNWLVLNAGSAPENWVGTLRRFQPDLVLLIDAAQLDQDPGAIGLLDPHYAHGFSASTHTMPLSLFTRYIEAELHCKVLLLGIQPETLSLGQPLTPAVEDSVNEIAAWLGNLLMR